MKLEILELSVVHLPSFGEHKLPLVLLYSGLRGENPSHNRGIDFLLYTHAQAALIKWKPVDETIIVARFRTRVWNLTIIQCYMPTDAAELQNHKSFYSQLNAIVDKVPKDDIKIYTGDLKAKIGSGITDYENVIGRHGLDEMSDNGELFAEFCGNPMHEVAWISHNGHTENQIDHTCINRKWKRIHLDVRNKQSTDTASDQHLLIGEIRLRIARI